jgi:hypothetical protein
MTHKFPLVDGLLQFASTSHARSVVTVAAVSFAVCHMVVLATAPTPGAVGGNLDVEIPRELVYLAAVLCRFAVPLGVMIVGIAQGRSKSRQTLR